MSINGQAFSAGYTAISDIGIAFLGLVKPLYDQLVTVSGAVYDNRNKYLKVDCNAKFDVSFKIGDLEYPLKPNKIIFKFGPDDCQLLLFESVDEDFPVVLGNPFSQEYCLIYDYTG